MSERVKRLMESAKSDCKAARNMALEAIEKHIDNIENENLRLARKVLKEDNPAQERL